MSAPSKEGCNPDHPVWSMPFHGGLHREGKRKQSEKGQEGACRTCPAQHHTAHLTAREGALVFSTRWDLPDQARIHLVRVGLEFVYGVE